MTEDEFKTKYPDHVHCIWVERTEDDLKWVVKLATILRHIGCRVFREYAIQNNPQFHIYWFIEQDHANKFNELVEYVKNEKNTR
jgi:hypothetical protein